MRFITCNIKFTIAMVFLNLLFSPISSTAEKPRFDSKRAFDYLTAQCDFGPRNPGSEGHRRCQDYLKTELGKYADKVYLQHFTFRDGKLGKTFDMNNIIGEFGDAGPRIILCAHWDTRPWADHDPNPANRNTPIIGANDGASGVAVLLEMARLFKASAPPLPIKIILFDGEDYGREGDLEDYLLGSKHFAQTAHPGEYKYAVLLDLIGDADLEIKRELNSHIYCRDQQNRIWKIAADIGAHQFSERMTGPIIDDHLSLINIGIRALDIIDFDYEFWHTVEDTPDKCSAESLEAVGRVLVELIYGEGGK